MRAGGASLGRFGLLATSSCKPPVPGKNDQAAVFKRLPDGASHARRAGDLQVRGGHDSGVPRGDLDQGAGERPSETEAPRRWDRNMARLARCSHAPCSQ